MALYRTSAILSGCVGVNRQRKCILICPMHALGLGTSVAPRKFEQMAPKDFILRGVRLEKCTGCMECVEVCPQNAIEVSF